MSSSLPVRGAWIEIPSAGKPGLRYRGRSPCGERGLKSFLSGRVPLLDCRSPCGERGLKSVDVIMEPARIRSLPVRGAWIEIDRADNCTHNRAVAPRAGSVD